MKREPNPWRSVARAALVIYTLALLTATHWPGLAIRGPINRIDLVIHCGVFCIWTCLLFASRLFTVGDCMKRRLIWTGVAGLCFAVFDETTQPLFSRVFDWWDLLADAVGVLIGLGLVAASGRVWPMFRGDLGD